MDLPQVLLLVVIVVIATILVIIGIQIIILLRDARETLKKADTVMGDVEFLTHNLTRSTSAFGHVVTGLESGVQLVGMMTKLLSPKHKKSD